MTSVNIDKVHNWTYCNEYVQKYAIMYMILVRTLATLKHVTYLNDYLAHFWHWSAPIGSFLANPRINTETHFFHSYMYRQDGYRVKYWNHIG